MTQWFHSEIPSQSGETHQHMFKQLLVNVHNRIIHNSQKVKQSKCPTIGERIIERQCVCSMWYCAVIKGKEVLIFGLTGDPQKHAKWKNTEAKRSTL